MKKVLFVVTSCDEKGDTKIPTGFNLAEVTHPLSVLEEGGVHVDIASIKGGAAPLDGLEDLEEPINKKYWADEVFRTKIANTAKLEDVDTTQYDAIFFAGGHGTMWDFPDTAAVQTAIREMYESGKIVSAVCHGPAALVNAKLSDGSYLVNGKKLAAFTDDEEEEVQSTNVVPFLLASTLEKRGALHQYSPNWSDNTVADGRLITGQNPQSAFSLGKLLLNALK
ncbi:type 1 glutamine amidotransferase domain-containing protein [uncultured Sphingobacterium sp.]|uniref:type 1 glutamine amidotransferase domain-containing protein n=1 Tax=uncultured Sphingobacterium sp. TaxID=182688 RepID=UPI00374A5D91